MASLNKTNFNFHSFILALSILLSLMFTLSVPSIHLSYPNTQRTGCPQITNNCPARDPPPPPDQLGTLRFTGNLRDVRNPDVPSQWRSCVRIRRNVSPCLRPGSVSAGDLGSESWKQICKCTYWMDARCVKSNQRHSSTVLVSFGMRKLREIKEKKGEGKTKRWLQN